MEKFRKLGLSEEVLKTLKRMEIDTPSEIQEKAIPFALAGKDIVGASKTGSGKTLAFSSAIIERIVPTKKIKAIVLTPTRELAEQVGDAIRQFSKDNLKVTSVYGGMNIEIQTRKMSGTDVLVGTPGRIIDHMNRRTIDLKQVEILVLDEFDRMLDMGFSRDVGKIIAACPKKRQTMLFSATLSSDVDYLAEKYTNNPVEVSVESHVDHTKLKQVYYDVPDGLKFSLLVHLLREEDSHLVMVFCSTRRNADFVVKNLNNLGINAKAIHGGLEQKKRIRTLSEFHSDKKLNILVCTDVAARGLDIKGVTHVYNYDIPSVSSDYIHRIGRTARAGEKGKAINILASRDYEKFSDVLNRENVEIQELELPYLNKVEIVNDSRARNRRGHKDSGLNRERIQLYDAVCMKCGKPCKVPFKPTQGKGVSCQDCFVPKDSNPRGRNKSNSRNNTRRNNSSRRTPSRRR